MLQIERFRAIEGLLEKHRQLSIAELEKHLGVSRATIYRDLKDLDRQGKVSIVRGGVTKALYGSSFELPYYAKRAINSDEKRRIAKAAVRHIQTNQSIFLDSSTTVTEMVPHLLTRKDIQIITNDLKIAAELTAPPELKVYVTGGITRPGFYTLTGSLAQNNLSKLGIDMAFLSCDAVGVKNGCMLTNEEEVYIKQEVIVKSEKTLLLCDHSKFESYAFIKFCNLDQIERIITGKELSDSVYNSFTKMGIFVERV